MSAIVEPISPNKALIMEDTMMGENDQQEKMKMKDDESLREQQILQSDDESLREEQVLQSDDDSLREEQILQNDHGSSNGVEEEKELEPELHEPRLYIICPERSDIVLSEPFFSTPKELLFSLKEASKYKLKFSFIISNNVVTGLKYINTTWKAGVRVDRTQVMLGNFDPREEPYVHELEENVTPSGIFGRGSYTTRTQVIDEKERCYMDIKYYFGIQKQWPESS